MHAEHSIDFRGSSTEFKLAGFCDLGFGIASIGDFRLRIWDLLKGLNSYLKGNKSALVIPAQQTVPQFKKSLHFWMPACAGMTGKTPRLLRYLTL
jgi:hypothetical protein